MADTRPVGWLLQFGFLMMWFGLILFFGPINARCWISSVPGFGGAVPDRRGDVPNRAFAVAGDHPPVDHRAQPILLTLVFVGWALAVLPVSRRKKAAASATMQMSRSLARFAEQSRSDIAARSVPISADRRHAVPASAPCHAWSLEFTRGVRFRSLPAASWSPFNIPVSAGNFDGAAAYPARRKRELVFASQPWLCHVEQQRFDATVYS